MDYETMPLPEHPHPPGCACVPAAAYLRVSKVGDRGDDLISPELQLHEDNRAACAAGRRIVKIIPDIDRSGRDFSKRRVGEMVGHIDSGLYRWVYVYRWDRWGRNPKDSLIQIDNLQRLVGGKQVVQSATEPFDTETTIGEFSRDQMLLIARLQSNQIRDGWKITHDRRRRNSQPHDGQPRFGYTYTKATGHVINPDQAPHLADAYRRLIAGETIYRLVLDWNAKGLRTTRGNTWEPTPLRRMLLTGFAAGYIREHSNPSPENKGKQRPDDFDVWRKGAHEPIIDERTWEAFKEKMKKNAATPPQWVWAQTAMAGLLVCGLCGGPMVIINSEKNRKWVCRQYRDKKIHRCVSVGNLNAEMAAVRWLDDVIEGGEDVQARAELLAKASVAVSNIAEIEKEVGRLKTKRFRLASDALDGVIDPEDAKALREQIDADLAALAARKAEAEYVAAQADASPLPMFVTLRETWPSLTPHDQREALARLVHHFSVVPAEEKGRLSTLVPKPRWET